MLLIVILLFNQWNNDNIIVILSIKNYDTELVKIKCHLLVSVPNFEASFWLVESNFELSLEEIQAYHTVILLQIVMVNPGTRLVKNHESLSHPSGTQDVEVTKSLTV